MSHDGSDISIGIIECQKKKNKPCTHTHLEKKRRKRETLLDKRVSVQTSKMTGHFKWLISSGIRDTMWTSYHPALCLYVPQRDRQKEQESEKARKLGRKRKGHEGI